MTKKVRTNTRDKKTAKNGERIDAENIEKSVVESPPEDPNMRAALLDFPRTRMLLRELAAKAGHAYDCFTKGGFFDGEDWAQLHVLVRKAEALEKDLPPPDATKTPVVSLKTTTVGKVKGDYSRVAMKGEEKAR